MDKIAHAELKAAVEAKWQEMNSLMEALAHGDEKAANEMEAMSAMAAARADAGLLMEQVQVCFERTYTSANAFRYAVHASSRQHCCHRDLLSQQISLCLLTCAC